MKPTAKDYYTNYNHNAFIEDCNRFNRIAGKDGVPTVQSLLQQIDLIQEELDETKRDLLAGNYTGLLDGYIDVAVTNAGLGTMLDALGMNIIAAMKETAGNNLSKFVDSYESETIQNTLDLYKAKDVWITSEYNPSESLVVFKDKENKVRKPYGFISNDLSKYIPDGLIIKE